MGKRGPQKTPTNVLNLRGSWRGKDRASEPDVPTGRPDKPPHLDGYALEQWERLVPMLEGMGVLTPNDRTALEIHCRTYAEWRTCCDYIDAHGMTNEIVTKENGTHRKEHPESVRSKQLLPILAQQLAAFGLTPAARSNVRPVDRGEEKDTGFFGRADAQ